MVIDTNILVDLLRVRSTPAQIAAVGFIQQLQSTEEALLTTRFNVAELYVGAALSRDSDDHLQRIDALLAPFQILDFDDRAARAYAEIEAGLRRSGRPVGDFDALIAATTLSHGQSLATRNVRHFSTIPGLTLVKL